MSNTTNPTNDHVDVYKWLSDNFYVDRTDPSLEIVKQFLLVLPIIELELFNGEYETENIPTIAENKQNLFKNIEWAEDYAKYFFERYQDARLYDELITTVVKGKPELQDWGEFREIITKFKCKDLNEKQKLTILLFVVFRYRKNIFHGDKLIETWHKYAEQIKKCLNFIVRLHDCWKASQTP
jgi:hypothetical protein